jgi:hypothetical protein
MSMSPEGLLTAGKGSAESTAGELQFIEQQPESDILLDDGSGLGA